jgi:hypothetical protein
VGDGRDWGGETVKILHLTYPVLIKQADSVSIEHMRKIENILRGMGTMFCLWPEASMRKKYLPDYKGKTPQQVDAEKLYSDWVKVGLDMSKAIEYYTRGQKV